MFVRPKRIKGVVRYYLVESYREAGRVRQRVLAYLGSHATVDKALKAWRQEAKEYRALENQARGRAEEQRQFLARHFSGGSLDRPPPRRWWRHIPAGRYYFEREREAMFAERAEEFEARVRRLEEVVITHGRSRAGVRAKRA